MRAKFGSVLDANVTDENCEFPFVFRPSFTTLTETSDTAGVLAVGARRRSWQTLRFVASAALLSAHAWGVRVAHQAARKAACASVAPEKLANECAAASRTWPLASGPASIHSFSIWTCIYRIV